MIESTFKKIKKIFPQTLYKRFLLIIIIPIISIQILSIYFFINRNWYESSEKLSYRIISEINYLVDISENNKNVFLNLNGQLNDIKFSYTNKIPQKGKQPYINIGTRLFRKFILNHFDKNNVTFLQQKRETIIYIKTPNNILKFVIPNKSFTIVTNKIFIFWSLGLSIVLLIIAWLFMRNQINPIVYLAKTMRIFNIKQTFSKISPKGASEIKEAIEAFNIMAFELQKYIQEKNYMLAGISHDLKTYLTRIKLQIALFENKEKTESLDKDITDMLNIVNDFIEYSKSEDYAIEMKNKINLYDMLNSITSKYVKTALKINLDVSKKININSGEKSIRRCFLNVIDNSFKYATKLNIKVEKYKNIVNIIFEDNGPGIEEKYYEDVFKPFFKIDNSRSLNKSGSGLGLAITKNILKKQNGTISISRSHELKGLMIKITIKQD